MLIRKLLENMRETAASGSDFSDCLSIENVLDEKDEETLGRLFARCNVYLDNPVTDSENAAAYSARGNRFALLLRSYILIPKLSYGPNIPPIRICAVCAVFGRCRDHPCHSGPAKSRPDVNHSV
jgi:hypothetical protein